MVELHSCTQAASGIDCTACNLAQICSDKKGSLSVKDNEPTEDYSISEELSAGQNGITILYLFIAGVAIVALAVLFTILFTC